MHSTTVEKKNYASFYVSATVISS